MGSNTDDEKNGITVWLKLMKINPRLTIYNFWGFQNYDHVVFGGIDALSDRFLIN